MSPARIRPNSQLTPARSRWQYVLLLASVTTTFPALVAAELSFSIFPAGDPRTKSARALAAQEALSALVSTARLENARLRSIPGMSIPAVGAVTTLSKLEEELKNVIEATESEIARCERETAEYLRRADNLVADRAHLSRLMSELAAETVATRKAVAETENATATEIRTANATRDDFLQLQDSTNRIRQEIRNVRNRLFPRLHQAAHLGWIHPPSSYRPLPQPLPPKSELALDATLDAHAGNPLAIARPDSSQERVSPGAVRMAVPITTSFESNVQPLLDRLPALEEKARSAAARRDEAIRTLESQRSEQDGQAARLSTLQLGRAAAASQLAAAKRNLTMARQTREEYAARRSTARATAVHAWIEWGLFQLQEKKAAALLASAEVQSRAPSFVTAWHDIAAVSVQLGSDPLSVIAAYPAQVAARGETLDILRQDLEGVRDKFLLSFVATSNDLPPAVLPYLTKGSP